MGEIKIHQPVKLISGLLYLSETLIKEVETILINEFGPIDLQSEAFPFNLTDYYVDELGEGILRKYIAFEKLIDIVRLPDIKIWTNEIEKKFSDKDSGKRKINIDPGYLTLSKMILATTKNYSHRIYLRDGIYAEVTLHYHKKSFTPWDWTYPDYKLEKTINFFNKVREIYKEQLQKIL